MNREHESRRVSQTRTMAMIGVVTAVFCILGPIIIPLPFSPIPLSLTNLVLFLSVYILGMKHSALSYMLYLFLGLIGLPVFSGFTGGPAKVIGPTGGYLLGFLFVPLILGFVVERYPRKKVLQLLGMLVSAAVYYLFGTIWLAGQMEISFAAALTIGVVPYLPGDFIKMGVAVSMGGSLRRRVFGV